MHGHSIPEALIASLTHARHVAVITGAGVSAESGVPTFRDAQTGLWAKYEPTELATPQAFGANPQLVWDWYQWRREKVLSVAPNPGHQALVQLASRVPRFTLITQNVDGLHQRAGSQDVIELHGNIMRAKCFDHHHLAHSYPENSPERPPRCTQCGGLMRPDVVWFNESLPPQALQAAAEAVEECDVFFSVGTSSVVHPAAALAFSAVRLGATAIEINPDPTPLTAEVTYALNGPAGEILPQIISRLPN